MGVHQGKEAGETERAEAFKAEEKVGKRGQWARNSRRE